MVRVPFPYTDRPVRQWRPAVVVSSASLQELHRLVWVVMVTSAENRSWPDDMPVSDLRLAGLPVASVVRSAKIATMDPSDASALGRLSPEQTGLVIGQIRRRLGEA